MGVPFQLTTQMDGGYVGPEINPGSVSPRTLIAPTVNMLYDVFGYLEVFQGCTAGLTNVGGPTILQIGSTWVTLNGGNAAFYIGKSIWWLGGSGPVKTPDPSNPASIITLGTNQSVLQVAVLVNGVYQAALQAGLSASDAPVIAGMTPTAPTFTGKNTGTFAVELTKFRSTTGAESNASLPSNVVSVSAQSIRVEMPGVPVDGTTTWNIYVTPNGFANSGPFLFRFAIPETDLTDTGTGTVASGSPNYHALTGHVYTAADEGKQIVIGGTFTTTILTVTDATHIILATNAPGPFTAAATVINSFVGGVVRAIEIEWSDNELLLSQKPPINHDPPPAGTFVGAIGNTMNVFGCYAGVGAACSIPGQPEAFDPDNVSFFPEPVTNVLGRPQDGYLWTLCANSISAAVYTGAVQGPPVMIKTLWNSVGCAGFQSAAVYAKILYLYTNGHKIARIDTDGNLDYEFARPVQADIATWTASSVVVGFDDNRRCVAFIFQQGAVIWHIDTNKWGKLDFAQITGSGNPTGNITSAYSQDGKLHLLAFESGNYNLYNFDVAGNAVTTFQFTTSWQGGAGSTVEERVGGGFPITHNRKTVKRWLLDYSSPTNFTLTGKVYGFRTGTSTSLGGFAVPLLATQKMTRFFPAVVRAGELFAVNMSGVGAGQKFFALQMEGDSSNIK